MLYRPLNFKHKSRRKIGMLVIKIMGGLVLRLDYIIYLRVWLAKILKSKSKY